MKKKKLKKLLQECQNKKLEYSTKYFSKQTLFNDMQDATTNSIDEMSKMILTLEEEIFNNNIQYKKTIKEYEKYLEEELDKKDEIIFKKNQEINELENMIEILTK